MNLKNYPELENKNRRVFYAIEELKDKEITHNIHSGLAMDHLYDLFSHQDSPLLGRGIKSFRDTCRGLHRPNRVCQVLYHFYLG